MLIFRRKGVFFYRVLSVIQLLLGIFLLFFAFYTAASIHGKEKDFPYFAGAFISGIGCVGISSLGCFVYYKGKNTHLEVLISMNVKPLVMAYLATTPCATCVCITGATLTGIYGLCRTDKCSYTENIAFNFGMAAVLFVLELLAVVSTILGLIMCVFYCPAFGIEILSEKVVPGTIQVKPANKNGTDQEEQVQKAQDLYVLQQWRHHMETTVDFSKVAFYLEHTRKNKNANTTEFMTIKDYQEESEGQEAKQQDSKV